MGLSKKKLSPLQIQTLGDAHFATPEEVAAAGLLGNKGIRLGYYKAPEDCGEGWGQIIRYSGDAHLITVAPTGSGKGRDVLVGALLEYEGSCIVIDPKGQLAAITGAQRARMGQKVIVLNPLPKELPMDLGPSAKYNPMAYLDPNSDAFGPSCEAIADSIVMHEDGPNSHFSDSARQLIAGVIMHLAAHGRDGEKNLVMMQRIVSGPSKVLEAFVAEALTSDNEGFISGRLARFATVGGEDRELRSIISTATTQCGFINNKAIGASLSASDFSFRDLKREATTVYLVLPAKFIDTCGKWFRLVLASAIAELWSDERGKYPILAIIDEFKQLGRLAVIADAMGMARGFGLQLWPILQDLTQLKENYGDQWETFLGGAAVRQFFAPRETFTADYISKLCGVKTVVTQGQSVQHAEQLLQNDRTGVSWGQQSQPLLHPHNVSSLGPNECLILGLRNTVIDAFRKPYSNTPELEGLYSRDPYLKTDTVAQNPAAESASFPPPTDSFAAREAAAAAATKEALTHKRALPLRLLTWGSSDNPILNVARKVEYFVTLPFRLVVALVTAPMLFGALQGKAGWAILAMITVLPIAVWEIWVKGPWDIYKAALLHQYAMEALQNNRSGGDPVESNNKAFWATFSFFKDEALALPGSLYESAKEGLSGQGGRAAVNASANKQPAPAAVPNDLAKQRKSFAKKIDDQVSQSTQVMPVTPQRATDILKDGFADMSHAFGMAPGESVPPPKLVSVTEVMKINLGEGVTIGRSGVLFTPLLHSDGLVQDFAAGSKNISLAHRLSGFEYPKAEPLTIGAKALPVLDSENHIVKPASGTVLVSVNGQFGAMYERDFNNPGSPPQ